MEAALDWLYGRDPEQAERGVMRSGGSETSKLTTPEWINEIHRLFPRDTIERAIKRGSGELEGGRYEAVNYEGYAPGGVAVTRNFLSK